MGVGTAQAPGLGRATVQQGSPGHEHLVGKGGGHRLLGRGLPPTWAHPLPRLRAPGRSQLQGLTPASPQPERGEQCWGWAHRPGPRHRGGFVPGAKCPSGSPRPRPDCFVSPASGPDSSAPVAREGPRPRARWSSLTHRSPGAARAWGPTAGPQDTMTLVDAEPGVPVPGPIPEGRPAEGAGPSSHDPALDAPCPSVAVGARGTRMHSHAPRGATLHASLAGACPPLSHVPTLGSCTEQELITCDPAHHPAHCRFVPGACVGTTREVGRGHAQAPALPGPHPGQHLPTQDTCLLPVGRGRLGPPRERSRRGQEGRVSPANMSKHPTPS